MTVREEIDLLLDAIPAAQLERIRDRIRLETTPASKTLPRSSWRRSRSEFHDLVYREATRLAAESTAQRRAGAGEPPDAE